MTHPFKNAGVRPLRVGLGLLCLSLFFVSGQARAEELLWKFEVPVHVKDIPQGVEHVVLHWYLYEQLHTKLAEDQVFFEFKANAGGKFWKDVPIEIYYTDLPDPSKADNLLVFLEFSQDGMSAYEPNTAGKAWTKSKPGTKLVKIVTVVKLQESPEKGRL